VLGHENFRLSKSGLMLNTHYKEFGASPDGIVECDCDNVNCGIGLVEVKCPYCLFDSNLSIDEYLAKDTCVIFENGTRKMNPKHTYFYQVQLQLLISGFHYADFVIWKANEVLIVREYPNHDFIVEKILKARIYFYQIIMPELLAGYFTKEESAKGNIIMIEN
jgi:hypothetical protein